MELFGEVSDGPKEIGGRSGRKIEIFEQHSLEIFELCGQVVDCGCCYRGRCNFEPAVKVRDPHTSSERLTQ